jgi:hypothetical protein
VKAITTGAQIRAARALLGWRRDDLARAAGLHLNAVAYWEKREGIPCPETGGDTPYACRQIRDALRDAGVQFVHAPGPGVAMAEATEMQEAPQPSPRELLGI